MVPSVLGGRYAVGQELGRGGAAIVFVAHDQHLDLQTAVKVLREELAQALGHERFLREIRIAVGLRHPHIVPVLDFGETDGFMWYTMPLVENGSLRQRLERESQLRVEQAVQWCTEIAGALAYAHEHGFVHRDVKPENILLDGEHALLADFGIARGIDAALIDTLTSAGIAVGTPAYMSPEQASGAPDVDGRSDVYSLACVLYECLAGVPPFNGPTPQSIIAQRFAHAPHPVSSYRTTVPAMLQETIASALNIAPADRPNAREMALELRGGATAERQIQTRRTATNAPENTTRRTKRRAGVAAVAIAFVAVVAIGITYARASVLDSRKVVVFPLETSGGPVAAQVALEIPILITSSLERVAPLQWIEGANPGLAATGKNASGYAQRLQEARQAHAGHFIDGSIIVKSDSVTVVLRLMSTMGDSALSRATLSAQGGAQAARGLALNAVGQLLPQLLEPGRRVDLTALTDRPANAVGAFMLGERDFRRSRYVDALGHYEQALAADSSFALAALKAARCARELDQEQRARAFVDIALAHAALLPGANLYFARGLSLYYRHLGDSAVMQLEHASRLAPEWAEIYDALGDVHFYVGVDGINADSAAESLYRQSVAHDSTYTPAISQLVWLAVRRGAHDDARRLLHNYIRDGSPDTTFARASLIAADCEARGVTAVGWKTIAVQSTSALWMLGKMLAGGGAQLECSRAAFSAVLDKPGAPSRDHWGGLLGSNAIAVVTADTNALQRLAQNPMAIALRVQNLLLLDEVAGAAIPVSTSGIANEMLGRLATLSPPELWVLGVWLASQKRGRALDSVTVELQQKLAHPPQRSSGLMLESLRARVRLLQGDTTSAVNDLAQVNVDASFQDVEWGFFESRAADNWLLATIALKRHEFRAAMELAGRINQSNPITNVVFLRAALGIQLQAARGLHDEPHAGEIQQRIARLDQVRRVAH